MTAWGFPEQMYWRRQAYGKMFRGFFLLFCFVGESGSWLVVLNDPKVHFSPGIRLVLGSLIIILLYIYK